MEPTHAYIAICDKCAGINAALVDDGWKGLSEQIGEWARDDRKFMRVELPVQLSCRCPAERPKYTIYMFDPALE